MNKKPMFEIISDITILLNLLLKNYYEVDDNSKYKTHLREIHDILTERKKEWELQ